MPRILVVEENKNLRVLYKYVLSKAGYEVSTVSSKEAALERLPEIDLVISELEAPNDKGYQALNHYYKKNNKIKLIVNTGYPLRADQSMNCRADAILPKSSNMDQLTLTIQSVLT